MDRVQCPECAKTMRFIALIREPSIIENILRQLNL